MKAGRKLTVFSWAMYDFANTIYSMNVITLYFALWVTIDMGGQDIFYSWVLSGSMFLAAITAPILGAISDQCGRRMPFLIIFTILSCLFTALIGMVSNLAFGLLYFAVANYGYQIGDMFYNSLLPVVSDERSVGKVSGYGTGLGYVGTIAGLLLVSPFALKFGRQAAFIPTGIFFFLFALPCFFFVKDRAVEVANRQRINMRKALADGFSQLRKTFVNVKKYSDLFRLLVALFISLNAINTVFIFMSVYIKKVAGFPDTEIVFFYIFSCVFAIGGALLVGYITDYFGPKKTLTGVLFCWCLAMLLAAISFNKHLFWVLGPVVGICLGGTWTSARAFIVRLSPPEITGEVFGFYGFVGKTASIIGPMIWGIVIWAFDFAGILKYRIAIAVLLLFLVIGLALLQKVPSDEK